MATPSRTPPPTTDDRTGLTPTNTTPIDTAASLELDGAPVTDLWRDLFDEGAIQDAFIHAVRRFAADMSVHELYDVLDERQVAVHLRSHIVRVARSDRSAAWPLLAGTRALGRGWSTVDDLHTAAAFFQALADLEEPRPTIAVRVPHEFREQRRDQREDVLQLVATLAQAFDVRVVAKRLTQRWLADSHRETLPGVNEWCNPQGDAPPTEALVDDALDALPADGTADAILERLASEPGETLPFNALYGQPDLPGDSAVRKQLGRLEDLGLVERFGPDTDRMVDLRAAGRAYLDATRQEQLTLDGVEERVSDPPNSSSQAVLSREHGEGETGRQPYRTRFLDRASHHAAAGTAQGGVTLVEDAARDDSEGPDHTRFVSFDDSREEIVVAVEASGALQYMTSTALAFASPRLLERVVTPTRVDALENEPAILRDARCIGALSEDALEDAESLREAFIDWGEELAGLTTDLRRGEYDDRDRFRSEILRSAHGLAGSLVHLFDALGVDVVREVRVPSGLGCDKHEELAEAVGVATAVQSRYGAFATYRQLFEPRDGKREMALTPTIDATEPTGEFIGSVVCRGTDLHRLRPHLEAALTSPAELHEDAPEFQVPVSIDEAGRAAIVRVAKRVLQSKHLGVTRRAVSVLHGVLSSPYTVARALQQLGGEGIPRDLAGHDLRYALATVDADHVLPDLPPTLGKVVAALLRADEHLSQRELAERADVSTQSVRNHRDTLEALGLVDVDDSGWRFKLPFPTIEERHTDRVPSTVRGDVRLSDVVSDVLAAVLPPEEYANPWGSVDAALSFPPDPWQLQDDPVLATWLEAAARLTDTDPPGSSSTISMGPEIEQQALAHETPHGADTDSTGTPWPSDSDEHPMDGVDVRGKP